MAESQGCCPRDREDPILGGRPSSDTPACDCCGTITVRASDQSKGEFHCLNCGNHMGVPTKPLKPRLQMVVGLAFNSTMDTVAMILKESGPECVVGNWNGVGGKMKAGETPISAMAREFYEETGADLPEGEWTQFAVLHADHYDLWFFWARTDRVLAAKTVEQEQVRLWNAYDILSVRNVMHNIRWMIPFLQDDQIAHDLGAIRVHR